MYSCVRQLYRLRADWQIPFQSRLTHYNHRMQRISQLICVLYVFCVKTNAAELPIATFSIVGFDPKTGDLGVAVQSKFFSVGSVVPWAKAGVGAGGRERPRRHTILGGSPLAEDGTQGRSIQEAGSQSASQSPRTRASPQHP